MSRRTLSSDVGTLRSRISRCADRCRSLQFSTFVIQSSASLNTRAFHELQLASLRREGRLTSDSYNIYLRLFCTREDFLSRGHRVICWSLGALESFQRGGCRVDCSELGFVVCWYFLWSWSFRLSRGEKAMFKVVRSVDWKASGERNRNSSGS